MDIEIITAKEGYVFQRKHDGMIFGNEIYLGIDYSTGIARQDIAEYYEEIVEPEIKAEFEADPIAPLNGYDPFILLE